MDARDQLLTIAELAIGIAGFSGVIAAFLQGGGLHPLDRTRFINLFTTSFATLLLAFVPFFLVSIVPEGPLLWRLASSILITAWVFNLIFGVRVVGPVVEEHFPASVRRIPRAVILVPAVLNLFVQLMNVSGLVWAPNQQAYIFGLLVYLYAAGFLFTYIILFRPPAAS